MALVNRHTCTPWKLNGCCVNTSIIQVVFMQLTGSVRLSYSLWTQNGNHFLPAPTDRQTDRQDGWTDRCARTDKEKRRVKLEIRRKKKAGAKWRSRSLFRKQTKRWSHLCVTEIVTKSNPVGESYSTDWSRPFLCKLHQGRHSNVYRSVMFAWQKSICTELELNHLVGLTLINILHHKWTDRSWTSWVWLRTCWPVNRKWSKDRRERCSCTSSCIHSKQVFDL